MEALIETMAHRMRRPIRHFHDLAFLDVPGRLAKLLLQLAEEQGNSRIQPPVQLTNLSQRELASLVGTTRERINKWINYFVQHECIDFSKGTVTLLKHDILRERITT
jgi:CRP/FNR family transcriptional regulator/CRP/FNR family cyclic AMP-dependent transcriptional regulator